MPKLHEIESYYTFNMIMDLIEILDASQSLEEERILKQQQEMNKKRSK